MSSPTLQTLVLPQTPLDHTTPAADDDTASESSFHLPVALSRPETFELRSPSCASTSPLPKSPSFMSPSLVNDSRSPMDMGRHAELVRATSGIQLSSSFYMEYDHAVSCAGCEEASASVYCQQCAVNYCDACDSQTHALKNRRQHNRISPRKNCTAPSRCPVHQNQVCEYFCNTCDQPVCALCRDYGAHQPPYHDVVSTVVVANRARAAVQAEAEQAQAAVDSCGALLAEVETKINSLQTGQAAAQTRDDINALFSSLLEEAGRRRSALLGQVDEDVQWRRQGLSQQTELLEAVVREGEDVRSACRGAIGEDRGHAEVRATMARVDDLYRSSDAVMKYTAPVERSEIDIELETYLLDVISTLGSVGGPMSLRFDVQDTGLCHVHWAPPSSLDGAVVAYDLRLLLLHENTEERTSVELDTLTVGHAEESLPALAVSVDLRPYCGSSVGFSVRASLGSGRYSAWTSSASLQQLPEFFVVKNCEKPSEGAPFDDAGLMYYLGTQGLSAPYANPLSIGAVAVSWSSQGSGELENFVAHTDSNDYSYTGNTPNSWMAVDIGAGREFRPTGYSLRHDMMGQRGVLRNWWFQARRDNGDWEVLSTHMCDQSLVAEAGSEAYFSLSESENLKGYRHFRILQTGLNSSGKNRLSCAGIELFGRLC